MLFSFTSHFCNSYIVILAFLFTRLCRFVWLLFLCVQFTVDFRFGESDRWGINRWRTFSPKLLHICCTSSTPLRRGAARRLCAIAIWTTGEKTAVDDINNPSANVFINEELEEIRSGLNSSKRKIHVGRVVRRSVRTLSCVTDFCLRVCVCTGVCVLFVSVCVCTIPWYWLTCGYGFLWPCPICRGRCCCCWSWEER